MREILFRGKRIDNGEWVYGYYARKGADKESFRHYICVSTFSSDYQSNYTYPFYLYDYEVDPSTVGQYTGLTDKNGKKIFEGDIVFLHDYIIGEIVFECGTFGIGACKPFDYDQLEDKIASITGCYNSPNFCYNDNFISLWELYWNYNQDDNILEVVEVFGNIHDNFELVNNSELLEDKT